MRGRLSPVVGVWLGRPGGSLRPLRVARVARHQTVHREHRVRGGGARGHHAHPLYGGAGRARGPLWPLVIVLGVHAGAVGGHRPPRPLGAGRHRSGGVRKFLK